MAVKIEILDYNYSIHTTGSQILGNSSFTDTSCWNTTGGWTIAGGKATHSGGYGHLDNQCLSTPFELGASYRAIFKVSGATQGNLRVKFRGASCSNLQLSQSGAANGVYTVDFIQQNCQLNAFGFMAAGNYDGSLEYVEVYRLSGIDWDKSIVGELEVEDHSDFPLALTFQIGDIKDITSTSGDYSKTFKVPATKNNNKLLKHIYSPNVTPKNNPTQYKNCRIVIDGLQSLIGVVKVAGMGGYGKTASYYNCVFYGNNMTWAKGLDEAYLREVGLFENSTGLSYNKSGVMATWQHEDSDAASPIVYPVTSYGDLNPDGEGNTIQLLNTKHENGSSAPFVGYNGWNNNNDSYGNPHPVSDWRPAIFVKTTLEAIFNSVGFLISSAFMDTDMFKKLVWLLPNFKYNNPEDRYNDLGIEAEWRNLSNLTVPYVNASLPAIAEYGCFLMYKVLNKSDGDLYYSGVSRQVVDISTAKNLAVTLNNGSYFDMSNDYITIGEYGNYDIRLDGLQAKVARAYRNSTASARIYLLSATVNVEVQTVGHTSWNIIAQGEIEMSPTTTGDSSGSDYTNNTQPLYSNYKNIGTIDEKGVWLNKGDKVRLTKGQRLNSVNNNSVDFHVHIFWKTHSTSKFQISIDPIDVFWGQTYDLDKVINKDYKQIDFIKGVAHAFNLVMTTDSENKVVYIEPFNDFYKTPANAIDWTSKLDRSREISDKFMPSDLKRNIVFKYKTDDNDEKVKYRGREFFNEIEDNYPFWEELSDSFDKGETLFENPFFAGTYNGADKDTSTGNIAVNSSCLWQDKGDGLQTSVNDWARPDKGYDFLPRLLSWNKLSGLDQNSALRNYAASVQLWAGDVDWIIANLNVAYVESLIYPQAVSYNRDNSAMPNLSYGNVWRRDYHPTTDTFSNYEIGKGLYETYYRGIVEMLKASPRIRTVYIDLKTTDIVKLDFQKLIYIDDSYWRISKVLDYKPNRNTPTKVELVEWIEVGIFALHPPSHGEIGSVNNWGTTNTQQLFDWLHNVEA